MMAGGGVTFPTQQQNQNQKQSWLSLQMPEKPADGEMTREMMAC